MPVAAPENARPPFVIVPLIAVNAFLSVIVRVLPVRSMGPLSVMGLFWEKLVPPAPSVPPTATAKSPPTEMLLTYVLADPFCVIAPPLITNWLLPLPIAPVAPSPSVPDVSVVTPKYEFTASKSTMAFGMLIETLIVPLVPCCSPLTKYTPPAPVPWSAIVLDTDGVTAIPAAKTTADGELLTIGKLSAPAVTVMTLLVIGAYGALLPVKMTGPAVEPSVMPPEPTVRVDAPVLARPKYVVPDASTVSELADWPTSVYT